MKAIKNITTKAALYILCAAPFAVVADMFIRKETSLFAVWLTNTMLGV